VSSSSWQRLPRTLSGWSDSSAPREETLPPSAVPAQRERSLLAALFQHPQAFTLRTPVAGSMSVIAILRQLPHSFRVADNLSRIVGSASMLFAGTIMARKDGCNLWHKLATANQALAECST
jgi:hypothetical protein